MSEPTIGWYKCIDMEAYLEHYSENCKLVEAFFEDSRVKVEEVNGGEGYLRTNSDLPIISEEEWEYFVECNAEGGVVDYSPDYKTLFEELLEVTENSDGVAGLHLNGDITTWDELENNGWLKQLKEWKEKQHA